VSNLINELVFFFQRLDWLSVIDLFLVAAIAFFLLRLVQGTQAVVLLRGMILLIIVIALLTIVLDLPAFSWLLRTALPALLVAIPVIFAPEIRRALERLGRAGNMLFLSSQPGYVERMIDTICDTAQRLADRRFGALIVIERDVHLDEYVETGVRLDARLTPQLLLQVFYLNTPLHDGAVNLRPLASVHSLRADRSPPRLKTRWAYATVRLWASVRSAIRWPLSCPKRQAGYLSPTMDASSAALTRAACATS
jgi:diadenylate cyclase